MARETKIGVALMVLLVGVFGAVAYKKWDGLKNAVASAPGDAGEKDDPAAPGKEATPQPAELQPQSNPFAATEPPGSAPPEATAAGGAADPFADATVASAEVPVRPVTATSADAWVDAPPTAQPEPSAPIEPFARQAEPIAQSEPSAPLAEGIAAAQSEPDGAFAEAAAEPMPAEPPADDPFGDVAAAATAEPAEAASATDDPFGTVAESDAAAATASESPMPIVAADDAFSAAASASADVDGVSAAEPTPAATSDPFADASEPLVAEAESEPAATETSQRPAEPADDPFASAAEPPAASIAEVAETPVSPAAPATDDFAAPVESAPTAITDLVGIEPDPVPATEVATTAVRSDASRTAYCQVSENDSYWAISKRVYGTTAYFHALAKHNASRIPDPRRLRPGMTVLTPPATELQARYPSLIAAATSSESASGKGGPDAGFLLDQAGRPAYRVGPDDTLGKIAQAHLGRASRWVQIYEMNRTSIRDAKTLKPGTVLLLPADASRVRLAPEG